METVAPWKLCLKSAETTRKKRLGADDVMPSRKPATLFYDRSFVLDTSSAAIVSSSAKNNSAFVYEIRERKSPSFTPWMMER